MSVSSESVEKTRKIGANIHSEILRRLALVTQTKVASRMGCAISTVSRLASDERLLDFCNLLGALEIRLAPPGCMLVDKNMQKSLMQMANLWLEAQISVFDEEEN